MKEAEKQVCQGRWAGMAVLAGLTFLASSSYAATISGQVTDGTDGLNGVTVEAYKLGETTASVSASTDTVDSTDGVYELDITEAGDYQLKFSGTTTTGDGGTVTEEWYEDAPSQECATPVNVASATTDVEGIDAVVEVVPEVADYTISGTITTGTSSTYVNVLVYHCTDSTCQSYDDNFSPTGVSTSDGTFSADYTTPPMEAGYYKVIFYPNSNSLASEWYDNKFGFGSAAVVDLTTASKSDIDAELGTGYSISGTVKDADGTAADNATVCIFESNGPTNPIPSSLSTNNCDGMCNCTQTTGGTSTYVFYGLPDTGSYKIVAQSTNGDLLTTWHGGGLSFDDATAVTIAAGNKAGIDVTLQTGGSISGLVTGPDDAALANIQVCAFQESQSPFCETSDTSATKNYTITGLPPGDYYVAFFDPDKAASGLVPELYDDVVFLSESSLLDTTPVTVAVATETKDINAKLEKGGSISGKVTDSAATPVALNGASVSAYVCMDSKCESMSSYSTESTKADGTYKFGALPSGKYKVKFDEFDVSETKTLAAEWYPEIVTVTAPDETKDINAALDVGGSISGTVTNDGQPLKCASVEVYGAAWENDLRGGGDDNKVVTDYQGKYTVENLSTDLYKVKMYGEGEEYQWYIGKAGHACANKVPVTAPDETTDIDAAFPVTLQQCGGGYYPWINMLL